MSKISNRKTIYAVLNTLLLIAIISVIYFFIRWIAGVFAGDVVLNPVACRVAKVQIHWYGICFILGFLMSLTYIIYKGKSEKQSLDDIINLVFIGAVFGMLGARLAFVSLNLGYFSRHPFEILNIWEGGLTLYGAVLLGFLAVLIYCKIRKINAWKILDIFAPAMMLGQVFGRWGNFFNQELFGYPTNSFLKMYISPFNRPWEYRSDAFFHPVFLYESILSLIAFVVLAKIALKKKYKPGMIFALYLIIYSIIRFAIEFVRIEPKIYMGLTLGQLVSAGIFVTTILVLFATNVKSKKS